MTTRTKGSRTMTRKILEESPTIFEPSMFMPAKSQTKTTPTSHFRLKVTGPMS